MQFLGKSFATRTAQRLRAARSRIGRHLIVTYYSALQAMSIFALWAGALLLVAVPIGDIAIGVDVMTTVALVAPEWALLAAAVVTAVHVVRWWRRTQN
ncbi:hypothetical protein AB0L57_01560 [Nocardia sp. NPDC052254]|uniref:hypothetical protein n=1 Tax=Nocardia sp. NPDC052254 TaxID=3155681 RepID=UPI00342E0943